MTGEKLITELKKASSLTPEDAATLLDKWDSRNNELVESFVNSKGGAVKFSQAFPKIILSVAKEYHNLRVPADVYSKLYCSIVLLRSQDYRVEIN